MKKTILTMAAVSALAIGAPAAAQTAESNVDLRVDRLQTQIQMGVRNGTISRAEAPALREQLRQVRQVERQYSRNGLTRAERQDLRNRVQNLRQQIQFAERQGDNRYSQANVYDQPAWIDRNRDGWDDRDYDRDGRWDDNVQNVQRGYSQYGSANWIDRNRDGWDDRDYDRDGRIDSGYLGQGGPYEEVEACESRGGIGGIIASVFGRDDCLRVGQRVSGNLYAVPYEYQHIYRDGYGTYYRSDGRTIYRIDARTNTVVGVYPMNR
jgi:hypothetical protein